MDEELKEVYEGLKNIENIMAAEEKRRKLSNNIMNDFIDDYLKTLDQSITNHVEDEFQTLKHRVQKIDEGLYSLEQ